MTSAKWRHLCLALLFTPVALLRAGASEPDEIRLWPGGAPGSEGKSAGEIVVKSSGGDRSISSIHNPSLTPYLPAKDTATGCAVLVIPGGGHRVLAIDHEGYNVARWLSEHGIAAFVLKYRLARETNSTYTIETHALADTQRALRFVRSRAQEWHINPARVGVMGFSAGGELAARASMSFDNGKPDASDLVDRQGSKPDFQALIYPGTSGIIEPTKESPPVFLACGYKDRKDISEGLASVYLKFKQVRVPAELHIFADAGHGFGLRASNPKPVADWIVRFQEWLDASGFLKQ
jgi:acetyl esterase/lipase